MYAWRRVRRFISYNQNVPTISIHPNDPGNFSLEGET